MAGDIDALIRKLDRMHSSIDDDVDEVLKNNAGEFARDTVVSAKSVMNKGYWTGNLARMIRDTKEGNMKYAVTSNAGYSGFLEYGTRYMAPETFMFPVYERYTRKVREDLERLINGKTGGHVMKQSAKLQLFNYLYEKFSEIGVPVIETKELNQELEYPFIAIQTTTDSMNVLTFDSFGGNPTAIVHLWGLDIDKSANDNLLMQVQNIMLDDIELEGFSLFNPQLDINESIEIEDNQALSHVTINIEYTSH